MVEIERRNKPEEKGVNKDVWRKVIDMLDIIMLFMLAFALEFVDNSMGGGFGTILSPLLIICGYDPRVIVPSILFSEMISGLWGGAWHWKYKNVNWRTIGLTLIGSLTGMALGTVLIGSILPASVAKTYISFIAIAMGLFVVIKSYSLISKKYTLKDKTSKFWTPILGMVIGFNKGSSGGGYGPMSVSGYMVLGLTAAIAIGTTTVAEGIACVIGIAIYTELTGVILSVALPIAIGSFIADPISAWLNNYLKKKLDPPFHGRLIGIIMTCLGMIAFLRTIGLI